jgi:cation transport ATPase
MSDYASEEQTHEQKENVNYEEKYSQEDYNLNLEEQHSQEDHEVKYEHSSEEKDEEKKEKEHEEEPKGSILYVILVGCFVITVVILGLMALVYSLMCFGYQSTFFEKMLGLLLAFFTGPFYFIYYAYNKSYCRKSSNGMSGGKKSKKSKKSKK